jgi:hypothetical protein
MQQIWKYSVRNYENIKFWKYLLTCSSESQEYCIHSRNTHKLAVQSTVIPYVMRVLRGAVTMRWEKLRCATSSGKNWVTLTLKLKDSPSFKMHKILGIKQLYSVWVAEDASFCCDSESNQSRFSASVQIFHRSEYFYPTHLIIFNFVRSKSSCSIPSCERS